MPKILIFESEPYVANLYRTKFEMAGFEAKVIPTIDQDTVTIVVNEHPDIVSLSALGGKVSGFDIATQLKKDPRTTHIPYFFLTNLSEKKDRERGMAVGAADYIIMADTRPDDVVTRAKQILELTA